VGDGRGGARGCTVSPEWGFFGGGWVGSGLLLSGFRPDFFFFFLFFHKGIFNFFLPGFGVSGGGVGGTASGCIFFTFDLLFDRKPTRKKKKKVQKKKKKKKK
jgi:hypothetical protein